MQFSSINFEEPFAMHVAVATPRRAKKKSPSKREDSLPEDLQDFVVGRLPSDRLFVPRASPDLSDGESDIDVFLTPPEREKLAKEAYDLTMTTPESTPTKTRGVKRNYDSYYGLHNDDDEELAKAEDEFGYSSTYKAESKVEDSIIGTQSSPIEILDDDEEAHPKTRVRLDPHSTPVKKERKVKVERTMSTTPLNIRVRHSNDTPSRQNSSSLVARFRNPNDSLSPSSLALLEPKIEAEGTQNAVFTPLRPQLRQSRRVTERRGGSESPISLKRLHNQNITTSPMIEHNDNVDDGMDFIVNAMNDDVGRVAMPVDTNDRMTFVDNPTTVTADDENKTITPSKVITPTPNNGSQRDFSTEQVFILAALAEVQMPPEFHSLLSHSVTGLPAFLRLAKLRIKQKTAFIEPIEARDLLEDICADNVGKNSSVIERNDWILLQRLAWCDAVQRMVLLEDRVPEADARLVLTRAL